MTVRSNAFWAGLDAAKDVQRKIVHLPLRPSNAAVSGRPRQHLNIPRRVVNDVLSSDAI